MDCLTNYIGLNYCNAPEPESGFSINDLPGMSTELADKIADSETINYLGVWNKVQKRAIARFKNDIQLALYKWVKFNSVIYQTRKLLKSTSNGLVPIVANPNYTGSYLMLPESKYVEFRLDNIAVYSNHSVTTTLKVWDVNDGTILLTKSIDLVQGLNTVSIGELFPLKYRILELFIGVDTTSFDSIQTLNDYYYWYDSDWACASQNTFGYGALRGIFQLLPATYNPLLPMQLSNIIRTGIGHGVVIGGEIRCSIEQFVCDNRLLLSQSLLYLLGSEMLKEKKNSPRLNYFTASNLAQTEETYKEFEATYLKNLNIALNAIPLNGESLCFDCEESFMVATKGMMP